MKAYRASTYLVMMICLFSTLNAICQDSPEPIIQYLSGKDRNTEVEWDFYCSEGRNSGEWTKIKVPSHWELENFGTYNYGHDHTKKDIPYGREYGLYKHNFNIPSEWGGKLINIVFDGSMTDTEVKINGKLAGEIHQGAFYRFKYDITELLNFGAENLLEVKVSKVSANESVTDAERHADYWIFGGIFRLVFLEVLPPNNIERLAINAQANGKLEANAFLNSNSNSNSIRLSLFNIDGDQIGESESFELIDNTIQHHIEASFNNIIAWNPETPTLYTLKTELVRNDKTLYSTSEKIGFRTVELIPNNGIYVNGEKIIMKGVDRHSFYPTSGRCLGEQDHLEDVNLIKDMNMNAVRMSHYPPDKRFLEICDSLGLFVLDELGGWQKYGYDTVVGPKLIKELILRDENHPSVIIWDFGNEGGWQFPNEKWFHHYDFQKRPIINPWLRINNTDTRHYPSYDLLNTRMVNNDEIFFPTELLHGLFDGGHGANLNDFWETAKQSPRNAGGFLWNLRDEAVWRTDLLKYDSDGNHAPDGIVGPHAEKEGSFYTIKEIWSPVQIKPFVLDHHFAGRITLENEFIYTNLMDCAFKWRLIETGTVREIRNEILSEGSIVSPDTEPGSATKIQIKLPDNFTDAEVLEFTATDPMGREIYTWRWAISKAEELIPQMLKKIADPNASIAATESENKLKVEVGTLTYLFDLSNAKLIEVITKKGSNSFNGGPTPVGYKGKANNIGEVKWEKDKDGQIVITSGYDQYPQKIKWVVKTNGLLELTVAPLMRNMDSIEVLGISFNYPESKMKEFQWMGDGPYRVYKNRLKGATFGVWKKQYNNTITGQSFDSLIYPEFKGYHSNLYWAVFETEESDFAVYCETPQIYLKMYNPPAPEEARNAHVFYPEGDIAFLHYIPGIGTKFLGIENLGPSAQPSKHAVRSEDVFKPIKLTFDFNVHNSEK